MITTDGTQNQRYSVGIGEFVVSSEPAGFLFAPNLGSCLGVALFDPVARVGGVIHCLLPLSQADPAKAKEKPGLYVDTGITALLESILRLGAQKNRLLIAAAGAGNINDDKNVFEIGKKNHTIFRKIMWKNGLLVKGENVGNPHSITLSLDLGVGEASVKSLMGIEKLF
jgi:chemotaxis protein CheD